LLNAELFRGIKRSELESIEWTSALKEEKAPGITAVSAHFNGIALWVAGQILDKGDMKTRFHLLCYFIRLAKYLAAYNNLDGARGVVAGLQSTPVYRLERTWAVIKSYSDDRTPRTRTI
jgi:Ras-specific guanine nucleotide-releasing factor RalGPS